MGGAIVTELVRDYCAFQREVTRAISPPGAQTTSTFAPLGPALCCT